MSRLVLLFLFVGLAIVAGDRAVAQACKPLQMDRSTLKAGSLRVYDLKGAPLPWIDKARLPAQLSLTDCGDPNFLMLQIQQSNFLVLKADLRMPEIDRGCVCPAVGRAGPPPFGAPGAGDLKFCPAVQCPR